MSVDSNFDPTSRFTRFEVDFPEIWNINVPLIDYRGSLPYVNFITVNIINAIFQIIPEIFG